MPYAFGSRRYNWIRCRGCKPTWLPPLFPRSRRQSNPIVAEAGVVTTQVGSPRPKALWADSTATPYTVDETGAYSSTFQRPNYEQDRGQPGTPTYTTPLLPPGDYVFAERCLLDPPKGPERYNIAEDDDEEDAPMEPASDSEDDLVGKRNLDTRKLLTMDKNKRTIDRRVCCLTCHSEQTMEYYNLCPSCGSQDSACALDHPLAIHVRDCAVLANQTRVIPYNLMLAIGNYTVDNIKRREFIKVEETEPSFLPRRFVGYRNSTDDLVYGGLDVPGQAPAPSGVVSTQVGPTEEEVLDLAIAVAATEDIGDFAEPPFEEKTYLQEYSPASPS